LQKPRRVASQRLVVLIEDPRQLVSCSSSHPPLSQTGVVLGSGSNAGPGG
jgi:hypothetical protein